MPARRYFSGSRLATVGWPRLSRKKADGARALFEAAMSPRDFALVDARGRRARHRRDHEDDLEAFELWHADRGRIPLATEVAAVVPEPLLGARAVDGAREKEAPAIVPVQARRNGWLVPGGRHHAPAVRARSAASGPQKSPLPSSGPSARAHDSPAPSQRPREHPPALLQEERVPEPFDPGSRAVPRVDRYSHAPDDDVGEEHGAHDFQRANTPPRPWHVSRKPARKPRRGSVDRLHDPRVDDGALPHPRRQEAEQG